MLSRCEFLFQRRPFNHGFTRCQIKESRQNTEWRCYLPYLWLFLSTSTRVHYLQKNTWTRKGHLNQVCYCYNIFISKLINSLLLLTSRYYGRKPRKWDCFVIKDIDFVNIMILWWRERGRKQHFICFSRQNYDEVVIIYIKFFIIFAL